MRKRNEAVESSPSRGNDRIARKRARHGARDIIEEAKQLPVDERVAMVDSLLRTLNAPTPEIDRVWARVAETRLDELRSGRVKAVPGSEVLARVKNRFAR